MTSGLYQNEWFTSACMYLPFLSQHRYYRRHLFSPLSSLVYLCTSAPLTPSDCLSSAPLFAILSHYSQVTFGSFSLERPINAVLHKCAQCDAGVPILLSSDLLPPQVTHLCLSPKFDSLLPPLPHSLTHLSFGTYFNQPVDNLPPNLSHLKFSDLFNNPVEHLPNGLTHLT